ncbi:hypothetical protein bcere0011_32730 [Bacillus cereus m1550]|nr:hypothetical protein bcere0011_32730 [Bacillus cereus m1550]
MFCKSLSSLHSSLFCLHRGQNPFTISALVALIVLLSKSTTRRRITECSSFVVTFISAIRSSFQKTPFNSIFTVTSLISKSTTITPPLYKTQSYSSILNFNTPQLKEILSFFQFFFTMKESVVNANCVVNIIPKTKTVKMLKIVSIKLHCFLYIYFYFINTV